MSILSYIGAAAWLSPLFYEHARRTKLDGRIISYSLISEYKYKNEDAGVDLTGCAYILQIQMVALNKSFHVKKIKAKATFDYDPHEYDCLIHARGSIEQDFDNLEGTRIIELPATKHLQFTGIFEKDKLYTKYLLLAVNGKHEKFDKLTISFENYRGTIKTLMFDDNEIDRCNLLYGDWKLKE